VLNITRADAGVTFPKAVAAFDVNAKGAPIPATRKPFLSGIKGGSGTRSAGHQSTPGLIAFRPFFV